MYKLIIKIIKIKVIKIKVIKIKVIKIKIIKIHKLIIIITIKYKLLIIFF